MTAQGPPAQGPPAPRQPARDAERENAVLRELVTVYRHLSGLAVQDDGLAGVVRLISERARATVAVVSQLMDVQAAASPGLPPEKAAALVRDHVVHPRLGQVLRASRMSGRALRLPSVASMPAVIVAPVLVGDEVPSYLITLDAAGQPPGEDMALLVTEHAATICGVILGRERVVRAAARRVRDDLVEGLLLGRGRDAADAGRWAAHLGYDPSRPHRVAAIAFELPPSAAADGEALRNRIGDSIEHFMSARAPDAIVSARDCEVVLVLAAEPDPRPLAASCLRRLSELFPGARAVIGIGGECGAPDEIARSYDQARRATQTLRRLGRAGSVTAFEDLGIHRLLLQVPDLEELRAFAREVLGPLSDREHERKSGYLATLGCYFRENSSPQRASRLLHVHPNTVAYRIKKIEEITGLRLDDYRDRLIAQVALEILDALPEATPLPEARP
jgi:sugar diacid utilization regulator